MLKIYCSNKQMVQYDENSKIYTFLKNIVLFHISSKFSVIKVAAVRGIQLNKSCE